MTCKQPHSAEQNQEREWRKKTEEEIRSTLGNIPCGLCIYRLEGRRLYPEFQSQLFYEIMGYSREHIQSAKQETLYLGVHPEDLLPLQETVGNMLESGESLQHTYRLWNDRKQEYRFIQMDGTVRLLKDGRRFVYCIFADVSSQKHLEEELKTANKRLQDIIHAIPGGIASYKLEGDLLIPTFFSDGVTGLSGHSREEYNEMVRHGVMDIIYELDRKRVLSAVQSAYISGELLDISYRMRHKNGDLIWIHLNGRRIGALSEEPVFYAVFTGMSAETLLFQSIAGGTADGIYVIDRENYELLFTNEAGHLFSNCREGMGQTCHKALYGRENPCEFCTLKSLGAEDQEHDMEIPETGRFYRTRFQKTDWNGIPAYVKYVRDVTEEVMMRREKERLELYFKTVVDKLPGGVAVICIEKDGSTVPEFISNGFAAMTHMTVQEAFDLYSKDILAGVHPDDIKILHEKLRELLTEGADQCELIGRMKLGDGGYVWVKNSLSMRRMSDGKVRLYCAYTDITKDMAERAQIKARYENLIRQHYRNPGSDALIAGHCNITKNHIMEIRDYTESMPLVQLGRDRENFFRGISEYIADLKERNAFLNQYLNQPLLSAYAENRTEQVMECFVRFPQRKKGCYARFRVNIVEMPDTGDVSGILTVTDITEQVISDRVLHLLSQVSHDYIIDLDLTEDYYRILSFNKEASCLPNQEGRYSEEIGMRARTEVLPKDKEQYLEALEADRLRRRLTESGAYTLTYSSVDEHGELHTKNIAVSSIDLRLGRVCLVCTDITESVRKQQSLLNMIAYTFELAGSILLDNKSFTMYTRRSIVESLPPYITDNYDDAVKKLICRYGQAEEVKKQFSLEHMIERLTEKPEGYDFVLPLQSREGVRYKQYNVIWGDQNHGIICFVRADVTDIMTAERQARGQLEIALSEARAANQAKSEFLSAMSHDIRTPLNAVMGMTTLAMSNLENEEWVADCLHKISVSSRHLLSLVNDVLDMSRLEQSQIDMNPLRISLFDMLKEISAIIASQAEHAGLHYETRTEGIEHKYFYGDSLRINQILLNLLSNAVKFTPEGGRVEFLTEEIAPVKEGAIRYRFTISDTGIGIPEDFLKQIFEPFAREASVSRIEGTGLGLSITKGLVGLMGGDIFIESEQGAGSVFRVELEFEPGEEETERSEETGNPQAMGENILSGRYFLVAEDNDINSEILCEILRMHGAEAVVRQDGRQTVEAFLEAETGTYDAILMDIQMPELNGYEATRAIRQSGREDAATIPVIAMSANAFSEDVQAALTAGMNAHVPKPLELDRLKQALSKVLSQE